MLMAGIVRGTPKGTRSPMVDGITTGIPKKKPSMAPPVETTKPSATKFATGVYGAGRTPEGKGNGR